MKILLVVDLEKDFCLGGSLAVAGSEEVVGVTNELLESGIFPISIASKDWHPANHVSFGSWPIHCVQDSKGAEYHDKLRAELINYLILKGFDIDVDSYSAFFNNDGKPTALPALLKKIEVDTAEKIEIFVCGLALDYCVSWTALDARKLGYETTLIYDATRAVNLEPNDGLEALRKLREAGVQMIDSRSLLRQRTIEAGEIGSVGLPSLAAVQLGIDQGRGIPMGC